MGAQTDLFNQPEFDGDTYESQHDKKRLSGQIKAIYELMKDGRWRTVDEIHSILPYPHVSISSQLRNLRKQRFGGHTVEKQNRGERGSALYEFRLIINPLD